MSKKSRNKSFNYNPEPLRKEDKDQASDLLDNETDKSEIKDETDEPVAEQNEISESQDSEETVDGEQKEEEKKPKLPFGVKIARLFAGAYIDEQNEQIEELSKQLEEAQNTIADKEAEIGDLNTTIGGKDILIEQLQGKIKDWETVAKRLFPGEQMMESDLLNQAVLRERKEHEADSYQKMRKQYGLEYSDIKEALNALKQLREGQIEWEAEKAKPQPLDEKRLDACSESEKSVLKKFINKILRSWFNINTKNTLEDTVDELKACRREIGEKNQKIHDLEKENAELKVVDPEKVVGEKIFLGTVSENIVSKLVARINNAIPNDDKKIDVPEKFNDLVEVLAVSLNTPSNHEDALRMGREEVLRQIKLSGENEEAVIKAVNEAIEKADNADSQIISLTQDLTEAQTARDNFSASLTETKQKFESLKSEKDTEIRNLKTDNAEALRNLEAKKNDEIADLRSSKDAKIQEITEKKNRRIQEITASKDAEIKRIREDNEAAIQKLTATKDAEIKSITDLAADEAQRLKAEKEAAVNKVIQDKKVEIDTLTAKVDEENTRAEKLYTDVADSLTLLMDDIYKDVEKIYTYSSRSEGVGLWIDERILENDSYGLADFKADLAKKIAAAPHTADGVNEALHNAVLKCLEYAPSWMDCLARLALYASVPFIHEQFEKAGANTTRILQAFGMMEFLMNRAGIQLDYPALFKDKFDASLYVAEPIKNISAVVSDIASHADDEEALVDLYSLGYKTDGQDTLPKVSRLNK